MSNVEMRMSGEMQLRTDVSSRLRRPRSLHYGYSTYQGFEQSLKRQLDAQKYVVLVVAGEPLSGKSNVMLSELDNLRNADTDIVYDPFSDCIPLAKAYGQVNQNWPKDFLSDHEFGKVSKLQHDLVVDQIQSVQKTGRQLVVGVEIPIVPDTEGRGTPMIRHLVKEYNAHVAMINPSARLRGDRKQMRGELLKAKKEDIPTILDKHGINPRETDLDKLENVWRMSGATPSTVDIIENLINERILALAQAGEITLPPLYERMNKKGIRIISASDLFKDKGYRAKVLGESYYPYVMQQRLEVPSERAFIGNNRKQTSVDHLTAVHEWNLPKRLLNR